MATDGNDRNQDPRYEREDARFTAVLAAGLIILAALVMTALGMWYFLRYSQAVLEREDKPISALGKQDKRPAPPAPRLQFAPKQDMDAMRIRENRHLSTYGWISKEAGVVHIPIERAMQLTLERGLPARSDDKPTTYTDAGTSYPMESSSGRTYVRMIP